MADIKNSRTEDGSESNHHVRPTPAKRRSAVNYVALSGHTPRQSRSSSAHVSHSSSKDSKVNTTPAKAKSYVLKFVDYAVDLAPFIQKSKSASADLREPPLYPLVREWVRAGTASKDQTNSHRESAHQRPTKSPLPSATDESSPNDNATQSISPHHTPNKTPNRHLRPKRQKTDIDTICHNLSLVRDLRN